LARELALEYQDMFNQEEGEAPCFFMELQRHGVPAQNIINDKMIQLAHSLDIPLVASNNTHFEQGDDFNAFEAMLAIRDNRTLDDNVAEGFNPEFYIQSHEVMEELFSNVPEALSHTLNIAERCNIDLKLGEYKLPILNPQTASIWPII